MTKYDLIAVYYDILLSFLEKSTLRPLRKRFVPTIRGKTLDIAVGTGNNTCFYPDTADVVLIDKSAQMLKLAKKKALKTGSRSSMTFVCSSLESLPFQDETFDTILSIDVFCSVENPERSLQELYRVLKAGGEAIFVEHMKTGKRLTDFFLTFLTIFTKLFASSSMIRPIDRYIDASDFKTVQIELLSGSFRYFRCTK